MKQHFQSQPTLRLLFWETTIKCNLACAHCRRVEGDEAADKDLSTAQAKELIEQLADLGKRQPFMPVLVFSGGEPLCREDLFEMVGRAKSLGIVPALATNGTLIDATVAQLIKDSEIARVAVSLDGATAEVHNKLRQLEGSFERAVEGIGHLRNKSVPFQVNMTLTRHNAGQLEDVYELAKSLGAVAVHIFMLVPVGCGQALAETDMLSPEQYEEKMLEIYKLAGRGQLQMKVTCGPHYERVIRQQGLHQCGTGFKPVGTDQEGIMNVEQGMLHGHQAREKHGQDGRATFSRGCLAGLGVLFVGHQGDVFPCGYLLVKCGNVLEDKLSEIWRSNPDLARMRDSNALEGKCGVCEYRQVCGGCRGRAYAATGNYMAEEPFCAYIPPEAVHSEDKR